MAKNNLTWDDVKKLSPDARRQVSEQAGGPPTSKPRPPSAPPAQPRPKTLNERYREVVPAVAIKPMPKIPSTPLTHEPILSSVEIRVEDDEPRVGNMAFTIMMVGLMVMVAPFVLWILSALLHWAWMTS